jgi:hypothetical protein
MADTRASSRGEIARATSATRSAAAGSASVLRTALVGDGDQRRRRRSSARDRQCRARGAGTADEAASLVAQRGHELEVLTEEFNEARERLRAQRAAAAAAATVVAEAEAQLVILNDQIAGVAETAYTGAGLSSQAS